MSQGALLSMVGPDKGFHQSAMLERIPTFLSNTEPFMGTVEWQEETFSKYIKKENCRYVSTRTKVEACGGKKWYLFG